ncbi:hypothetical protein HO291_003505 [Salmonella enterica]|nr:hypothetical protein [Salmonella enterica]
MRTAKKVPSSEIPFPEIFSDKKLITKVVPIFNVMHDTALTEKEAVSFLDLLWRYANEQLSPDSEKGVKVIVADAGTTVVQEIRKYYDQRPFTLDFDGIQVEITAKMSITDALRAGMNATLSQVITEVEEPETPKVPEVAQLAPVTPTEPAEPEVKHRKKVLTLKKPKKTAAAKPEPKPEPVPEPKAEPEEPEDDQSQYVGLQTYGVNPGEPLSRAVARVWPHRPALLAYNGKTIPITVEMSLVDAQIEAADMAGIDGNAQPEAPQPTISQSGRLYAAATKPYDIAHFDYPIPVDDSDWNISDDRTSDADFVRTNRAVWLEGYPYRISCIPFDECMNTELMFYVHCKIRPEQEMFDVYHRLFLSHTHKVHVRKVNPDGEGSRIMTHEYCSWRPKNGDGNQSGSVVSTVMEALGLNCRWEQGARYRIRYWDTNVNTINHRYYASRPTDEALTVLRHPKLKPVIQTRPAGI